MTNPDNLIDFVNTLQEVALDGKLLDAYKNFVRNYEKEKEDDTGK